jgi:Domain of unknown function (DUF5615)
MSFLLDEQLPKWWRSAIVRLQPHLRVWKIGDLGAPALESSDPELLRWCEQNSCFLVTNNRRSMPAHLAGHVASGNHVPGVLVVNPDRNIKDVADVLSFIEGASLPGEYEDQIRHLPKL